MTINSDLGIIIQARTSSTRFPKKIIRVIENEITFLDILISRIKKIVSNIPIVIATSTNKEDQILNNFADKHGIPIFFGSEENVLERFLECSGQFSFKSVVRICSDNPYLDIKSILELINNYQGEDYLSFSINSKPCVLTHSGFYPELVKVDALKKVYRLKYNNCIEHVTNCLYSNPEKFKIRFINKEILEDVRCTLDTEQDFENLKFIYFNWFIKNKDYETKDLIKFIKSQPFLLDNMKAQIIKNSK